MLRLDLKDIKETVLFLHPTTKNAIIIRKEKGDGLNCELYIETGDTISRAMYDFKDDRDAAYERVLNEINEYLFPQFELKEE